LHSIIGASVFARSSATMLAVIAAIFISNLQMRPGRVQPTAAASN
jgi:hypothetical protein